jgi:hypothetical protein
MRCANGTLLQPSCIDSHHWRGPSLEGAPPKTLAVEFPPRRPVPVSRAIWHSRSLSERKRFHSQHQTRKARFRLHPVLHQAKLQLIMPFFFSAVSHCVAGDKTFRVLTGRDIYRVTWAGFPLSNGQRSWQSGVCAGENLHASEEVGTNFSGSTAIGASQRHSSYSMQRIP